MILQSQLLVIFYIFVYDFYLQFFLIVSFMHFADLGLILKLILNDCLAALWSNILYHFLENNSILHFVNVRGSRVTFI